MSQEKVNFYKEQKANRKQIMKKEKRMRIIRKTVLYAAAVILVGWIGYSGYASWTGSQPVKNAEVDYTAFAEYLSEMYAAE